MKLSSIHRIGLAAILFENLNADFGLVIGRADKRYTLWKYNKKDDAIHLAYIQVLSTNRFAVEQRFPEVYICEELRGEHRLVISKSTSSNNKPASAPKTIFDFIDMPFGDFRGVKISNITAKNWCWFANNTIRNNGNYKWTDSYGEEFDFEELVLKNLNASGCKCINNTWYTPENLANPKLWLYLANTNPDVVEYQDMCKELNMKNFMGRWISPISIDGEQSWMTVAREVLPLIAEGKPFSFIAETNANHFYLGIPIDFKDEDKACVCTYYGISNFLKITNKKGEKVNKRVKGKTIEVLEYEIVTNENNKSSVLVNKFNIR